jgi:hypothetical protein
MNTSRTIDQRGSISGFVVVLLIAVMGFAGLVIDGARIVATKVSAADHAENAARAGAQEVERLRSGVFVLDPTKAEAAAQAYLAAHGIDGFATASPNKIVVTVTSTVSTTLLSLVGVSSKTITATRSSTPVSH